MSLGPMDITYRISTPDQITIGFHIILTCPACGADRGLCLTTAGDYKPVTGSCPNGHVWDERRVFGAEVKRIAIETANIPGKD